jgi:hypothetical protein
MKTEFPESLRIEPVGFDRSQFPRDRVRGGNPRLPRGSCDRMYSTASGGSPATSRIVVSTTPSRSLAPSRRPI